MLNNDVLIDVLTIVNIIICAIHIGMAILVYQDSSISHNYNYDKEDK